MSLLFDSTMLIAHLRGDDRATELLLDAADEGALASVISRTEIEGGMRSGERRDVSRLFDGLLLLPVTDAVARRAGRQLRRFRRSHPGIDLADYLIAATAEEEGASLVTLNVKHFPMFSGLRPPW
jgi:predicted nucleic acid-binding protein